MWYVHHLPESMKTPTLCESRGRRPKNRSLTKGADSNLPGWQPKEKAALTAKAGCDCLNSATVEKRPEAVGWAPLVGRPADYLPSGTVGQWLPAACNGGKCKGRRPWNRPSEEASTWLLRQLLDPEREGEGTRGPPGPPYAGRSGVAQFTPLRQLRPPEVCPLVSHGRLDTGTSALEDTSDLDSEVNFHWRHRQDSADGLEYRCFFVPLRKW